MTKSTKLNEWYYYNPVIWLLSLLFSAWLTWWVTGTVSRLHDIVLAWLMINSIWLSPRLFKVLFPILAIWVGYAAVGFFYGYPDTGMITSLLQTNPNEAKEFFDLSFIMAMLAIVTAFIVILKLSARIIATRKQRKGFMLSASILSIVFISQVASTTLTGIKYNLRFSPLLNFIPFSIQTYFDIQDGKARARQIAAQADSWQIIQGESHPPKYQNYVLVMGESSSKNYLSAYGYPVETSPFLASALGVKYTHMISPAAHTVVSIPRMLAQNDANAQVDYPNSIIALANKIGMRTYWLSNQGEYGEHDSQISYIAHKSHHRYYNMHNKHAQGYDSELLPEFRQVLQQPTDAPKFIVLHLMGSHADFCQRLEPQAFRFDIANKQLGCYLSTLKQTDDLLRDIYHDLQASKQSFSLVYLSDHGLKPLNLKHGISKDSLQVPLFKLSSDDTQQSTNDNYISGMGFIWFLSDWLGVRTENQRNNGFLTQFEYTDSSQVIIFDNENKAFDSLESFDNQVLTP